jgi:5'-methylthioadenosine phosphorylase
MADLTAEIGVFGGSGFYSLIDGAHEEWVETPYGAPSDRVALGEIERIIAFRRKRLTIAQTCMR